MKIYFDNGATSYPKAPGVKEKMIESITDVQGNSGRTNSSKALDIERTILETRDLICDYFKFDNIDNVVFTKNITESINVLLKGSLNEGDHVIISGMEHNAVIRPLNLLKEEKEIEYSEIPCDKEGIINYDKICKLVKPNTKMIMITHASNVTGSVVDLKRISQIAKQYNLFLLVDAAQSAGVIDIDMLGDEIDGLMFTGHKSLLGPSGIGGFIISDRLNKITKSLIQGGTGSKSEFISQPDIMPDKFEAGTPNITGIYGLNAALKYHKTLKENSVIKHELELSKRFIEGLKDVEDARVIGITNIDLSEDNIYRLGVISVDFTNRDNSEIGFYLEKKYGISTRIGLHCAPLAHKSIGTFPLGTVRFSFSYSNNIGEVDYCIEAIKKILKEKLNEL